MSLFIILFYLVGIHSTYSQIMETIDMETKKYPLTMNNKERRKFIIKYGPVGYGLYKNRDSFFLTIGVFLFTLFGRISRFFIHFTLNFFKGLNKLSGINSTIFYDLVTIGYSLMGIYLVFLSLIIREFRKLVDCFTQMLFHFFYELNALIFY